MRYVQNHFEYPPGYIKKHHNTSVLVQIQFVINSQGNVVDVSVLNNVDRELTEAAMLVNRNMPTWRKPGMIDGEGINFKKIIPMRFTIKS